MSSRIVSAIKRSIENPTRPLTDTTLLELFGGELLDSGIRITHETAYRMAAVYRAHALLAGLMGAMPLQAFTKLSQGREQQDWTLGDEPNEDKTPFEFWEFVGLSLLSHGNGYIWKERDGLGEIQSIWNVHPKDVTIERDVRWATEMNRSGKTFLIDGRRYGPDTICHIPGMSYDGTRGLSPIQLQRQGIGINMAAQSYAARLFGRGMLTQGVLETDQALDEPQARRLQRRWREKTAGGANQWRIPVLDNGAKYKPITLPPEDALYLEIRKFEVREIATLHGLPPHLLSDVERSTSWGSGIEQQNLQLLTFTFDPWLVRAEQRISKEIRPLGRPNWYVRFNRKALLRADSAARYMAYQRSIMHSIQNPDEIRELEEMPPIPGGGGQTFYRPSNLAPVGADAGASTDSDQEE